MKNRSFWISTRPPLQPSLRSNKFNRNLVFRRAILGSRIGSIISLVIFSSPRTIPPLKKTRKKSHPRISRFHSFTTLRYLLVSSLVRPFCRSFFSMSLFCGWLVETWSIVRLTTPYDRQMHQKNAREISPYHTRITRFIRMDPV